jgi:hypothetical protein
VVTVLLATLLGLPAAANAWVSLGDRGTAVTSPTGDAFGLWNIDTDSGTGTTIDISGTATLGADSAADKVDLVCTERAIDPTNALLKTNVPVDFATKAFSATNVSLKPIHNRPYGSKACTIYALPVVGYNPSPADLADFFSGPRVAVSSRATVEHSGKRAGFTVTAAHFEAFSEYHAAGAGSDVNLRAPENTTNYKTFVLGGAHSLIASFAPLGSSFTVDGVDVFVPSVAQEDPPVAGRTGFKQIDYTVSQAPDGNMTIVDTETLLKCATPTDILLCTSYAETPIQLIRTLTETGHQGRMVRTTDQFVSTDGFAHSISLSYSESYNLGAAGALSFALPGQSPVQPTSGTTYNSVPSGSIYVSDPAAADGSIASGRVSTTLGTTIDSLRFSNDDSYMARLDNRTVPASGALTIDSVISESYTGAELLTLTSEAAALVGAGFAPPNVGPGGGNQNYPAVFPPSFTKSRAKAIRDKKTKRSVITSGRSLVCPAGGAGCSATAKLTATYKVKKKKKLAKFATVTIAGAPGTTTPIVFKLSKKNDKLFASLKKLKFTLALSAGTVTDTSSFTLKAPKPTKKKRK